MTPEVHAALERLRTYGRYPEPTCTAQPLIDYRADLALVAAAAQADRGERMANKRGGGWLARQLANSERNTYEWPEWMRREVGMPQPENNALNDLRAKVAWLEAELNAAQAGARGDERARAKLWEDDDLIRELSLICDNPTDPWRQDWLVKVIQRARDRFVLLSPEAPRDA